MSEVHERMWMYTGRRRGGGIASEEFIVGVQKFDEFARSQVGLIDNQYRCPCSRCKNKKFKSSDQVKSDLYMNGFVNDYWVWVHHGEIGPTFCQGESSRQYQLFDLNETSTMNEDIREVDEERYGHAMQSMVYDIREVEEAAVNNDELPNERAQSWFDMLQSSQLPCYDGCRMSELEVQARLLSIKSDFNPSHAHFKAWLKFARDYGPEETRLPKDMPSLMRKVTDLGLQVQKINCCINGCILYYKLDYDSVRCKFCKHERWKPLKGKQKVGTAFASMYYLPLTERLQRLYASKNIASHMRWHKEHQREIGVIKHPSDAKAWKNIDELYPDFASEPRNVRLGLCADGFTPYNYDSRPYSIWPIVVTPYNLPPSMCNSTPFLFLTCLIPGPKSPNAKIDVFLQTLIDELKLLWNYGAVTYDISSKINFNMRVILMWTVNDFPAYGMLSGWSTHGRLACPICMEYNPAQWLHNAKKQSWFDNHRCFLPKGHSLRRNTQAFSRGEQRLQDPPERLSGASIYSVVKGLKSVVIDGTSVVDRFKSNMHNWIKRSIFWDLPYWADQLLRHNIDVMHTEKNFSEAIINTVMDVKHKSKDDIKDRKDMEALCDRTELNLIKRNGRTLKPKAKFTLTKQQNRDVCEWMRGIRLPDGYCSNPKNMVDASSEKFGHMKSHDHHVFIETLLPVAFSALPAEVLAPLSELSDFFKSLCSSVLEEEKLAGMIRKIPLILCKLECIFPPSFWNVMEHLPIHLAEEALLRGPVHYGWMYPFERLFGKLKPYAKNKAHPEISMIRVYLAYEIAKFTSVYFNGDVDCMATRIRRNEVPEKKRTHFEDTLSVFKWKGYATGKSSKRYIAHTGEIDAMHLHVLLNCDEVQPYLNGFKSIVLRRYPNATNVEVAKFIASDFPEWFKREVALPGYANNANQQYLIQISYGPENVAFSYSGYVHDGVKFVTQKVNIGLQTYGSGVCVKGTGEGEDVGCDYYGVLTDVIRLKYIGFPLKQCMLFRCHWFDTTSSTGVLGPSKTCPYPSIKHTRRGFQDDPFIFADMASQVIYLNYPPRVAYKKDWWVVIPNKPRGNIDGDIDVFQEDTMTSTYVRKYVPTILVDENEEPEDISDRLEIVLGGFGDFQNEMEDQELGEWEDGEDDCTEDELIPGFVSSGDDDDEDDTEDEDDDYT